MSGTQLDGRVVNDDLEQQAVEEDSKTGAETDSENGVEHTHEEAAEETQATGKRSSTDEAPPKKQKKRKATDPEPKSARRSSRVGTKTVNEEEQENEVEEETKGAVDEEQEGKVEEEVDAGSSPKKVPKGYETEEDYKKAQRERIAKLRADKKNSTDPEVRKAEEEIKKIQNHRFMLLFFFYSILTLHLCTLIVNNREKKMSMPGNYFDFHRLN